MDRFYRFDAGTTVQPVARHAARRADTRDGDGRLHGIAMTAALALAFSGVLPGIAVCAAAALMGWS